MALLHNHTIHRENQLVSTVVVKPGRNLLASSSVVSGAPPVTMEAEMIAANSQTSTPSKLRSPAMDCRLLASACSGSFQSLESLLHGEIPSSVDDEESFLKDSLLGRVTVGGDTVLHAVATYGDSEDFLSKARLIHGKASSLLSAKNDNGDTPLHCATRAGNFQMLSLLVQLAHQGQDSSATRAKALLETENKRKWTVLHEAVRVGENRVVKFLMEKHPELAGVPRDGGTSPLYLAVLMGNEIIAETLHQESRGGVLSYSGPNGQNALHAAVLRGKALTTMLLEWNNALTGQQDENGSTPLHLAASVVEQRDRRTIRLLLLNANPNALYQPDHEGSFPIHVAASVDARDAISEYIENSPSCAGLRDVNGRTFLHVAAEKRQKWTVIFTACMYQSLSWILNMQDNDGNTVLHITVQAESLIMFWALFANRQVDLNLTNGKGQTPLDIAGFNRDKGSLNFNQNSEVKIYAALKRANAKSGIFRQDYFKADYILQKRQGEKLEMEKLKDSTQNLCIVSALIATVTFGATFAMPGGYRADDHTNGGTPTLAGRYAFDAFTWANALAFTSATIATTALMCSGSPWHNTRIRVLHLYVAFHCMSISIKCLVAAFAIGTYVMLAPVAHKTAVAVCALSSLVLLYEKLELVIKQLFMVAPFCVRRGVVFPLRQFVYFVVGNIVVEYWPIIVILCATIRSHPVGKVDQVAQPPTSLP